VTTIPLKLAITAPLQDQPRPDQMRRNVLAMDGRGPPETRSMVCKFGHGGLRAACPKNKTRRIVMGAASTPHWEQVGHVACDKSPLMMKWYRDVLASRAAVVCSHP
jgi:hypothetical protein